MIFRYTILYVPDVRACLDFYARAFGLTQGFLPDALRLAKLGAHIKFCGKTFFQFLDLLLVAAHQRQGTNGCSRQSDCHTGKNIHGLALSKFQTVPRF